MEDLIEELVGEISDSLLRHPNALISLARLKNVDEYTYMHSVAVCALMIALARQLGLDEAQVRDAGLAGIVVDRAYGGQGLTPAQAVARTLERLEGAFALVFLFEGEGTTLMRPFLLRMQAHGGAGQEFSRFVGDLAEAWRAAQA